MKTRTVNLMDAELERWTQGNGSWSMRAPLSFPWFMTDATKYRNNFLMISAPWKMAYRMTF